ncbi:hypothetical protein OsJ_07082 [Oryza sativa Japonica Group]|uniref:Uncharacterized protein n=1 Tax=Oryza sativa subsp. japonica TaxID=39947 RepID=A3A7U8_ORYSJ|nr:hypothetical protein OsJ_07082 [Oryza sativa Japonica Group]
MYQSYEDGPYKANVPEIYQSHEDGPYKAPEKTGGERNTHAGLNGEQGPGQVGRDLPLDDVDGVPLQHVTIMVSTPGRLATDTLMKAWSPPHRFSTRLGPDHTINVPGAGAGAGSGPAVTAAASGGGTAGAGGMTAAVSSAAAGGGGGGGADEEEDPPRPRRAHRAARLFLSLLPALQVGHRLLQAPDEADGLPDDGRLVRLKHHLIHHVAALTIDVATASLNLVGEAGDEVAQVGEHVLDLPPPLALGEDVHPLAAAPAAAAAAALVVRSIRAAGRRRHRRGLTFGVDVPGPGDDALTLVGAGGDRRKQQLVVAGLAGALLVVAVAGAHGGSSRGCVAARALLRHGRRKRLLDLWRL